MNPSDRVDIEVFAENQAALDKIVAGVPGIAPSQVGDCTTEEAVMYDGGGDWVAKRVVVYKKFEKLACAHIEGSGGHAYVRTIMNFSSLAPVETRKRHMLSLWADNAKFIAANIPGKTREMSGDACEYPLATPTDSMVLCRDNVTVCVLEENLGEALAFARDSGATVFSAPLK